MDLKAQYDAKVAEARAILDKAKTEGRAMSAEEVTAFDAKMAEADGLKATLERQAKLEAENARSMKVPPTQEVREQATQSARVEVVERKREPGEVLGVITRFTWEYGRDKTAMLARAEKQYGASSPEYRALGVSDFTAGGALVPDEFSSEIIPLLMAQSVFRKAGANVVPLRGVLDIPAMTGGVTYEWVGENQNRGTSEPTFGQYRLIEKTGSVVTPIANDLLRLGGPAVDRLIRDNIVRAVANGEDAAFLKGTGTAYSPKGIYYQMTSGHNSATAGTSLANFRTDIANVCNLLAADNIPANRRCWIFNPRTVTYMKWELVDSNSNYAFPELRNNNTLNGWPVYETNNITTGTNVEWYLVEMSLIYIGDGPGLQIKVQDGAAYYSSSESTVVAGLSRDQSVISALKKTDMVMVSPNAAACRNTVTK